MAGRIAAKTLAAAALIPLLLGVCLAESLLGDFSEKDVRPESQGHVGRVERLITDLKSAQASAAAGTLDAEGLKKAVDSAKAAAAKTLARRPRDAYVLNSVARLHLQAGLGGPRASVSEYREGLAYAERAVAEAGVSGDRSALKLALRTRGVGRYYAEDYPPAEADADHLLRMDPKDPVGGSLKRLIAGRAGPVGAVGGGGAGGAPGAGAGAGSPGKPAADEDEDWAPRGPGGKPLSAEGARVFVERMRRTDVLLERREYAAAREEATQSLMEYGDNPRAYLHRARALQGLRMHREAVADSTRGLEFWPASWRLLTQRAMAYNEAGRFSDALADAEAALAKNPEAAASWLVRGLARRSLGEPPESYLEDMRRAAEIEPVYRNLYAEALRGAGGKTVRRAALEGGERRPAAGSSLPEFLKKSPPLWVCGAVGVYLLIAMTWAVVVLLRGRSRR